MISSEINIIKNDYVRELHRISTKKVALISNFFYMIQVF